jgi:LacI family transcriptional regulator, repressor for deo operon, udp, cdd, tsx, nupC, and nupG
MKRRTKIKDIAEMLGVSSATVSRALTDSTLVAEATRRRIHDLAAELDYRPNVSARNLRTQRSMSVLLVVRDVINPFYLEILKSMEATARAAGYSVLMGNIEDDPEQENQYFDMLRDGHADGMILMTGKLPTKYPVESFAAEAFPIVVALELIEGVGLPHVQIDNVGAAREAVRHLIELGHRRIAHITGPLPEIMSLKRREGYRAAMAEAGLPIPEGYEQPGLYLLQSGRDAGRRLFEMAEPPTAVFAANDEMAFGAIQEMRRLGFEVPDDVSVVGFDDLLFSEAFHPPLTTVSQPRTEIGHRAMALLLEILSGERGPNEPIVVPTTLRIRGSTAPPKT